MPVFGTDGILKVLQILIEDGLQRCQKKIKSIVKSRIVLHEKLTPYEF